MSLRFALECREAVRWANRLAHSLGQEHVDTPHLLDGLLMVEEGHASNIVKHLLGDYDAIRADIWATFPGRPREFDHLAEVPKRPQTESFKRAVEGAIRVAEETDAGLITTGHMLAAMAEMSGDTASEFLRRRGITSEAVLDHGWVPRGA